MYSLTHAGIIVSVAGTALVYFGFSESCSNEIAQLIPVAIGGIMSWIGRVRAGGVTLGGFRR